MMIYMEDCNDIIDTWQLYFEHPLL